MAAQTTALYSYMNKGKLQLSWRHNRAKRSIAKRASERGVGAWHPLPSWRLLAAKLEQETIRF